MRKLIYSSRMILSYMATSKYWKIKPKKWIKKRFKVKKKYKAHGIPFERKSDAKRFRKIHKKGLAKSNWKDRIFYMKQIE